MHTTYPTLYSIQGILRRMQLPLRANFAILMCVLALHSTSALAVPLTPALNALPTGGQVAAGKATIQQSGSKMTVNQTTATGILNWKTFTIGSSASVTFNQPNAASVTLNRVNSADPSAIYGQLNANGQLFLLNPNGVIFGSGSSVNAAGLVASTLTLSDSDFLNAHYIFNRNGSTASVTNQGDINARYVALLAPDVVNQGVITASMGTVAMAGGEAVTLSISGQDLVNVQVDKATINTLVTNGNLIQVDGGTVILSAQSANGLLGQAVNTGQIEASGITVNGGVIRLAASSSISNTGTLSANAAANAEGGNISVIADLANPGSQTTINGTLSAKGGTLSGNGGFIETSAAHLSIKDNAIITTQAANGKAGTWLLDPYDFVIAASGGDMTGATLSTALSTGNVLIQTTATTPTFSNVTFTGTPLYTGKGDIVVNDAIRIDNHFFLHLESYNDIYLNAKITGDTGYLGVIHGGTHIYNGPNYEKVPGVTATDYTGSNFGGASILWSTTPGTYVFPSPPAPPPPTDIYVQLTNADLSSIYGTTPTFTYGFYYALTGGTPVSLNPTGSIKWTTPITALSPAAPYSELYTGTFALSGYTFNSGTSKTWTVNPKPLYVQLTNSTLSSTYGTAPTFTYGFYDASTAGNPVTQTPTGSALPTPSGFVAWSNPITASSPATTNNELYSGNLALTNYTFNPGPAQTWTVNPMPVYVRLTNSDPYSTAPAVPTFTYGFYDASTAGNAVTQTPTGSALPTPSGNVKWSNPITAASTPGTYTETYKGTFGGLTNYTINAGDPTTWTVIFQPSLFLMWLWGTQNAVAVSQVATAALHDNPGTIVWNLIHGIFVDYEVMAVFGTSGTATNETNVNALNWLSFTSKKTNSSDMESAIILYQKEINYALSVFSPHCAPYTDDQIKQWLYPSSP